MKRYIYIYERKRNQRTAPCPKCEMSQLHHKMLQNILIHEYGEINSAIMSHNEAPNLVLVSFEIRM